MAFVGDVSRPNLWRIIQIFIALILLYNLAVVVKLSEQNNKKNVKFEADSFRSFTVFKTSWACGVIQSNVFLNESM